LMDCHIDGIGIFIMHQCLPPLVPEAWEGQCMHHS
jgi:hypothetical protein